MNIWDKLDALLPKIVLPPTVQDGDKVRILPGTHDGFGGQCGIVDSFGETIGESGEHYPWVCVRVQGEHGAVMFVARPEELELL